MKLSLTIDLECDRVKSITGHDEYTQRKLVIRLMDGYEELSQVSIDKEGLGWVMEDVTDD